LTPRAQQLWGILRFGVSDEPKQAVTHRIGSLDSITKTDKN